MDGNTSRTSPSSRNSKLATHRPMSSTLAEPVRPKSITPSNWPNLGSPDEARFELPWHAFSNHGSFVVDVAAGSDRIQHHHRPDQVIRARLLLPAPILRSAVHLEDDHLAPVCR